jgi:hypothetical protein
MENTARSILLAFGAFFLITTCVGFSLAQTSRGTVAGTVTDQTGAVISGADVELKKQEQTTPEFIALTQSIWEPMT